MEIKYEAVFGPQELFDGFMDDCEFTDGTYGFKAGNSCVAYCERHNQKFGWSAIHNTEQINVIAMRRIIRTPTWSVADRKAGKLPEVGCKVFDVKNENEVIVKAINMRQVCLESSDGFIYLLPPDDIKPIESPEEKAARLREEWCSTASKLLKNLEYSSTLTSIYDALLSGDLPVPVKENK